MKFHHISLRVRDFEKSMHFYQTLLGLSVAKAFQPTPTATWLTCRMQRVRLRSS